MQNSDLISIIIPTYNRANLLIETLESLSAQSYTNWECILVDDGSTSDNIGIIRKYIRKDKRIKLYQRDSFGQPKGANACRNIGIDLATGEFIIFFDSDDLFLLTTLGNRLKYFQKHPDYDFIVFQTTSFFEKQNGTPMLFTKEKENYLHAFLSHDLPWNTLGPMLKSSFVKNSVRFDLKMPRLQDPDFYTGLLMLKNVRFKVLHDQAPDVLYRAGDHTPNLTNVFTGFTHYINKYAMYPQDLISRKLMSELLNKCYSKAYQHFRRNSNLATVEDTRLILQLTYIAYRRKIITFRDLLSKGAKLIYFYLTTRKISAHNEI